MSTLDLSRPGVWRELWPQALGLMTHLEGMVQQPLWTFGGGTVLMLRHGHRLSKDIDLFVPDPQYLGYVNPRLSDVAEAVSADYEENAEFVKLYLPQGEIDIVVGAALTAHPYEVVRHAGREIKVERSAEIIAKKMWHRGDRAKARVLGTMASPCYPASGLVHTTGVPGLAVLFMVIQMRQSGRNPIYFRHLE